MVNPNHITPYGEISTEERDLADDLVFNRREDALERFIAHFESKGEEAADEKADPTEGMEPEEALHFHILRRKKDGVEEWIDRSVEKIGAILTKSSYAVVDLGKQVPISTIIDAAKEHDATAIGLSALLVSTSKRMPACIQELHSQGLRFPVLIGGAAINRDFGLRVLYPGGRESDEVYEPGVFYCKDAFEGLAKMDQIVDGEARTALVAKTREAAQRLRDKGPEPEQGD